MIESHALQRTWSPEDVHVHHLLNQPRHLPSRRALCEQRRHPVLRVDSGDERPSVLNTLTVSVED